MLLVISSEHLVIEKKTIRSAIFLPIARMEKVSDQVIQKQISASWSYLKIKILNSIFQTICVMEKNVA